MILHKYNSNNVTVIQNRFIDDYMISANGEFVKVYLYLLRCSSLETVLTLSSIADALNHTENDVKRALAYWEKYHLLHLTYDEKGELSELSLTEPNSFEEKSQARVAQYAANVSTEAKDASKQEESKKTPSADQIYVSPDRKSELAQMEEVRQLLYVAEQYLGKQLSNTEVNHILYFYDDLKLSFDLLEYLLEYCVSKGKTSIHYMRKVAFEWKEKGIKTIEEAKQDSNLFQKEYYAVLKAFGISGRGPAEAEISYMSNWFNVLGYTLDVIVEACNRTITNIHNPSFPYADSILQDWNRKGVRHLTDLEKLEKTVKPVKKSGKGKKDSKDFGFEQRDYDFKQLEEQLLGY